MTDWRLPYPPSGQETPAFCFVCIFTSSDSEFAPLVASWTGAGRDGRKSSPGGGLEEKGSAAARLSCRKVRDVCTR